MYRVRSENVSFIVESRKSNVIETANQNWTKVNACNTEGEGGGRE